MKKLFIAFLVSALFISCSSDDYKNKEQNILKKENTKDFLTLENLNIINSLSKEYNYNLTKNSVKIKEGNEKNTGIINDN